MQPSAATHYTLPVILSLYIMCIAAIAAHRRPISISHRVNDTTNDNKSKSNKKQDAQNTFSLSITNNNVNLATATAQMVECARTRGPGPGPAGLTRGGAGAGPCARLIGLSLLSPSVYHVCLCAVRATAPATRHTHATPHTRHADYPLTPTTRSSSSHPATSFAVRIADCDVVMCDYVMFFCFFVFVYG